MIQLSLVQINGFIEEKKKSKQNTKHLHNCPELITTMMIKKRYVQLDFYFSQKLHILNLWCFFLAKSSNHN